MRQERKNEVVPRSGVVDIWGDRRRAADLAGGCWLPLATRSFATPWGRGLVVVSGDLLVRVQLPAYHEVGYQEVGCHEVGYQEVGAGLSGAESGGTPSHPWGERSKRGADHWAEELEAYFRGERLGWSVHEVPIGELAQSTFARRVYEALLGVVPGETVSYSELAELAGHPRAARAVGNAMARNPIPVVVPCHRVICADGCLGRYGEDPRWKERLLSHERKYGKAGGRGDG